MFNLILLLLLIESLSIGAVPEESFLGAGDEDDMYLYLDTRSETDPKQSETRRRSTLDKNFARFGRGGDLQPADYDVDGFADAFARPTRSGERSDQFIRFGRGGSGSDFVRFGRDRGNSYKLPRTMRAGAQHFVRFGRSATRNKRSTPVGEDGKRSASGSNFVRFGRNDNFMRFGRDPVDTEREDYLLKLLLEVCRKSRLA